MLSLSSYHCRDHHSRLQDDESDDELKDRSNDVDVEMGDEDGDITPSSPSQPVEVAL